MVKTQDFDAIKIKLSSPEEILQWSYAEKLLGKGHGEITKPETINYRTQRPEKDGLFCEKIFGPTKNYECYCGKYKGVRYKGIVCDKCGVEITKSAVRRERIGYIKLAIPVAHIWFLRTLPSRIGILLSRTREEIEKVIYFVSYIITKVDEEKKEEILNNIEKEYQTKRKQADTKKEKEKLKKQRDKAKEEVKSIKKAAILEEPDYEKFSSKYSEVFEAGTGTDPVKKLLEEIDLSQMENELKEKYEKSRLEQKKKIQEKLKAVRGFIKSQQRPEWMCLQYLPVLPPDLRPMVQLDGGRYASSDLNDLYRRIINRNNRLKYLIETGAPEVICRNEKRMLQEAVDALIDNAARKSQRSATLAPRRELKSLADMLRGKQGRFRQNLLGKRVDYSGRSVIVSGPELNFDEVGMPKKMALELFKPFIINRLIERGLAHNVKSAGVLISEGIKEVWEELQEITQEKYVLLNRAPTLHKLSIQGFKPILTEGESISLHPLVCPSFNADFDGDQMAVHLPLSKPAQRETKNRMLSSKGILKPATGKPIAVPRQEMILGCFFLTEIKPGLKEEGKVFSNTTEAKTAYELEKIDLQTKIKIRIEGTILETSVGRVIFNENLPEDFPFQNETQDSKNIKRLISILIEQYSQKEIVPVLDKIKNLGFEYATLSSNTWGMEDLIVPEEKSKLVEEAEKKQENIRAQVEKGTITEAERREQTIEIWKRVKEKLSELTPQSLPESGPVVSIVKSGARASWDQIVQMAGMKGLVADPTGSIMELPIKENYKKGLTSLEYFLSTHGARKGTTDTALRTSKAGYLSRRLIDTAHELIVREKDCGDTKGIVISREDAKQTSQSFAEKIEGRISLSDIKVKGKTVVKKGSMIDEKFARLVEKSKVEKVKVRSPMSCQSKKGICQLCYGMDLNSRKLVNLGSAIGVLAGQAIGEPGTQLTLRTFHTGGAVGAGDITSGLPRVEEVFETRHPKGEVPVFEEEGKVETIKKEKEETIIKVRSEGEKPKEYKLSPEFKLLVEEGELVYSGQPICEGRINIEMLFEVSGKEKTQKYILNEVQKVYANEGVCIHDKHIECIIYQMFSRVKISKIGDSHFSLGQLVPIEKFYEENKSLRKANKEVAQAKPVVLGISKVALSTDSWLSAASFQQTSQVLIESSIEGKMDNLNGLKENVIIGKMIPAGTGFKKKSQKEEKES